MRTSVRKRYAQLDQFVRAANLGRDEIPKHNVFPTLVELDPFEAHRKLLARIVRAFQSKFRKIIPPADVPLLMFPRWRSTAHADWRRLHCYALVRRLFDSLDFLTRRNPHLRSGTRQIPLALQVSVRADGSIARVRDPYEDFLAELSRADLRRLQSCRGAGDSSWLGATTRKPAVGAARIKFACTGSGIRRPRTQRIGSSESAPALMPFDTVEINLSSYTTAFQRNFRRVVAHARPDRRQAFTPSPSVRMTARDPYRQSGLCVANY